ncbi:hypothetical protein UYA_00400 [Ectopseudomonas alcaliphila JAB1]|nr:PAAR domain-containing protein [Pseudomonas alcaliphila]APU28243.1 hypothetical protein UYA_00400 [Pseudomonas alcaliphila JAB1]
MSGKPAARLSDPTACPIPGHGTNPIAAGSPDVLFDSLPAARMGDASACGGAMAGAVIPTVLINGKPAAVVGSVGSHGNVVVSGSGTVIIGTSGGGSAFSPVAPLSLAAAAVAVVNAVVPSAQAAEQKGLDYGISLKRGGNRVLTPLMIPDYEELAQGTTKNLETIDFLIRNRKQEADSLTLEVFDGEALLYSETDTTPLLPEGEHLWQWDGYDQSGALDTRVLKSEQLLVRLTARKAAEEQVTELRLNNSAQQAAWVDARVDRNGGSVELTVRPSFSDGGVTGRNDQLTARTFEELKALAKSGVERYWSRDGSRGVIGASIQTDKGVFQVKVLAQVNEKPSAKDFPLIASISDDFGRSTSFAMFKKIYHNQGWWAAANYPVSFADQDFEHTAAHELGHLILNEYGDGGVIPEYSWSHKSTSTILTQKPLENNPVPASGEIDLMHYHSDGPSNMQDYWARSVASEKDVKGLLWLARVKFNA